MIFVVSWNACWREEDFPTDWRCAQVVCICKKGSIENPDNYRPISVVCVGYKTLAALLLKRLQDGGAEARLTMSQYGFRRGRDTVDAIFAVRRHIDLALAPRSGAKALLALDWKKAFDSINIQGLLTALERFGVPSKMVRLVRNLYSDRMFAVRDGSNQSAWRQQCSGISQGCPLSPFLFTMTMSIIIQDAIEMVPEAISKMIEDGSLSVVLYYMPTTPC